MSGMIIHCGGYEATVDEVANVPTPEPTQTHYPVPHIALYERIVDQMKDSGMIIKEEQHALHTRSMRSKQSRFKDGPGAAIPGCNWFWFARVESERDGYDLVVSARNSHGMYFASSTGIGEWTTVCDNLLFSAEFVLSRKHTRYIYRDLPLLVKRAVGSVITARTTMEERHEAYCTTPLSVEMGDHLIMEAAASRVVAPTKVLKVRDEFLNPSHDEHLNDDGERTVNTFVQACTEVYKESNIFTLPKRGTALHCIADTATDYIALAA